MIRIGLGQLLAALLLILNAFALEAQPLLMFLDLALAAFFIWTAFSKIDPPSVGPSRFAYRG